MMKTFTRVLTFFMAVMIMFSPALGSTTPAASTEPANSNAESAIVIDAAVKDFKNLSKKEKKSRLKEVKKAWKKYKADKKAGKADDETNTILLVILAFLLPPLAIWLKERRFTWKFWLSLALIILPIFTAWWVWGAAVILAILVVLGAL